jgi:hypothetical protein
VSFGDETKRPMASQSKSATVTIPTKRKQTPEEVVEQLLDSSRSTYSEHTETTSELEISVEINPSRRS